MKFSRWCVLTGKELATYEKEKDYGSAPTEIIDITIVKTIKSDEKSNSNIFKVETSEGIYLFQAKNFEDKESWIGAIGI
jgi:hypothetical protein